MFSLIQSDSKELQAVAKPPEIQISLRECCCVSKVCAVLVLCGASVQAFFNSCFIGPISSTNRGGGGGGLVGMGEE